MNCCLNTVIRFKRKSLFKKIAFKSKMFLNVALLDSFSFIFVFSNKHYNLFNKLMWQNSRQWCLDSNPRPSEHELTETCNGVWTTYKKLLFIDWRSSFESVIQLGRIIFLSCDDFNYTKVALFLRHVFRFKLINAVVCQL